MGRPFNKNATNDYLIEEIINDDRYQIRKDGRIFFLKKTKDGEVWVETGKAKTSKRGRQYFHLCYQGKCLKVHRIVYRVFNGNLDPALVVDHNDDNSLNNLPNNLILRTVQENTQKAYQSA
jgi:hypothetical protein